MKQHIGFMVGFALIVAMFVMVFKGWHREHNPQFNNDSVLQTWVKLGSPSVPVKRVKRRASQPEKAQQVSMSENGAPDWSDLPSRTDLRISDEERDLIMDLSWQYDLPSWLLFAVWRNESRCLSKNWKTGNNWRRSRDLVLDSGGRCTASEKMCLAWDALRAICDQRRNGRPICNPNEVHSSYALALGPMQEKAYPFLMANGRWQSWVVDYDGDGIIDPHQLPDAMATAAKMFDTFRQSRGSLNAAVQAYAGNPAHNHYQRLRERHRADWCAVRGYCSGDA